ncbi:MAG: divalent-cation tolerance protein CutA [Chloroflexota bacterium]
MASVFQLETTTDSLGEAKRLAAALVEKRLAACVQIVGPIASTFRWQGRVQEAEEFLLLCKAPKAQLEAATALIEELHSYDVPEVLAFEVAHGSRSYLEWVAAETARK